MRWNWRVGVMCLVAGIVVAEATFLGAVVWGDGDNVVRSVLKAAAHVLSDGADSAKAAAW